MQYWYFKAVKILEVFFTIDNRTHAFHFVRERPTEKLASTSWLQLECHDV